MHVTRRLIVSGKVQGVGFRYAMARKAAQLDVRGWVRNRADGSVEALMHGTHEAVVAMIAWARIGPPTARVTGIAIEDARAEPTEFRILRDE